MITELSGILFLLVLGVVFDQTILVLVQSRKNRWVLILILTFFNNAMIFLVLVIVYFIDGMTVRGEYGEGWLDWVTLVEGFLAAYLPVSLAFVWRVIVKNGG